MPLRLLYSVQKRAIGQNKNRLCAITNKPRTFNMPFFRMPKLYDTDRGPQSLVQFSGRRLNRIYGTE